MDGQDGVEQMGKPDAVSFRYETEEPAVAVETPGPALFDNFQARLIVAIEENIGNAPGRILVRQLDGFRSEPLNTNNGNQAIRKDAPHGGIRPQVLKSAHPALPF